MTLVALVLATLAALLHVLLFALESLLWTSESTVAALVAWAN